MLREKNVKVSSDTVASSTSVFIWRAYLFLLLWAPLPLASNRLWSSQLLVLMAMLLMLVLLISVFRGQIQLTERQFKARLPISCLLLLQCLVALQILPVFSVGSLASLSPIASQTCQDINALGISSCASLSVVPQISIEYLCLGFLYLAMFVLALQLIDSKVRLKTFAYVVILSAVFQAAYGVFMVLGEWHYLFIVEKWTGFDVASGTFVNRNHLGAYLNLGLALGVGLLITQIQKAKERSWRELARDWIQLLLSEKFRLRLMLAVMVVGLVMTRSRGANTAFFAALSLVALLYLFQQKQFNKNALILFISLFVVDAFIVGQWFGFEELKDRIQATDVATEQRLDIYSAILPGLSKSGVLGLGAGAAESTIPMLGAWPAHAPFQHAHNDYIELTLTFGLLGALCLLVFMASVSYQLIRHNRKRYGVFMAIIYLVIHSFTDFSLYIPAVVVTLMPILALAYIRFEGGRQRVKRKLI